MSTIKNISSHFKNQNQTTWLIYAFITIFVLVHFVQLVSNINLNNYLCLNAKVNLYPPFWSWFTYAWLHNDIVHLLMNCISIYAITTIIQTYLPKYAIIKNFIIGSVCSGIIFQLISYFTWQHIAIIGASAGIVYLLFTIVALQPLGQVRIPLIGYLKLWHIGLFFVVFDLLMVTINHNIGGATTHLIGAVLGLTNGYLQKNKIAFRKKTTNTFSNSSKNIKTKKSYKSSIKEDKIQQKIDKILDKINKYGYESLSEEEKQFLFKQE